MAPNHRAIGIARPVRAFFAVALVALFGLPATASEQATSDQNSLRPPLLAYRRTEAPVVQANSPATGPTTTVVVDSAVSTASHAQPRTKAPRRLAPVNGPTTNGPLTIGQDRTEAPLAANFFSPSLPARQMLVTSGAGLAIVVGLLLACAWLVRRGRPHANDSLPPEAFAVLGKAPLFGQTVGHLIRLGNKLVLVAATADGIQPLVEVTDHEEVDRLSGLCLAKQSHSSAAEFQQVLRSLAREPAKGFLGRG